MTELSKLSPKVKNDVSFQRYDPAPAIDGVWLNRLSKRRGDNGAFMEYLRLSGGVAQGLLTDFTARQISISQAAAGRINAFHIHPNEPQNELWTVVEGQLKVWLVDCRAGSASEGVKQQVILNGEEPAQLYIPAGVAHGYQAGQQGALLVYAMDQQFDRENPNEGRLPWDYFGAELWAEDRG